MEKIQENLKNKVFFTSDLHFDHDNIIMYCHRPYPDRDEMNESLIDNFNKKVPADGITYILGDIYLSKKNSSRLINFIHQLNGEKHLILGNHDYYSEDFYKEYCGFRSVQHHLEIVIGNQIIVMNHYPMLAWNHIQHDSWMLYGHVHGLFTGRVQQALIKYIYPLSKWIGKKTMDVGVDNSPTYSPFSFDEIKQIMDKL